MGDLLEDDGFTMDVICAGRHKTSHSMLQDVRNTCTACIILGSPASANDDLPYLKAELDIIQRFIRNDTPLLGICLGAQLIAKAAGAKVYRGDTPEIGFYDDITITGDGSRFFRGFEEPFTVFHWHGDTFDLPPEGVRLASSPSYRNQAIQVGSAVGLQFHLEVDRIMIPQWLDRLGPGSKVSVRDILASVESNMPVLKNGMKKFYANFKLAFDL